MTIYAEEIAVEDAIPPGTTVTEGGDTSFERANMQPSKGQEFRRAIFHLSTENGNSGDDFTYHVEHSTDDGSSWSDLSDVFGNRLEGQLVDAEDEIEIAVESVPRGHDLRLAGDSGDKSTGGGNAADIAASVVKFDAKETPV